MPIRFATQAAMAATDTTAYTDFTLAETEDQHLLWILDKTSVATVGTGVVAANPAGRWFAPTAAAGGTVGQQTVTAVAGTASTQQTTAPGQAVGGVTITPSSMARGSTFVFAAQFYATTGTAEVTLFDVTNNVTIATLTTTSTSPDEKEQALTTGAPGTNVISSSKAKYEVRARFSTGTPGQSVFGSPDYAAAQYTGPGAGTLTGVVVAWQRSILT